MGSSLLTRCRSPWQVSFVLFCQSFLKLSLAPASLVYTQFVSPEFPNSWYWAPLTISYLSSTNELWQNCKAKVGNSTLKFSSKDLLMWTMLTWKPQRSTSKNLKHKEIEYHLIFWFSHQYPIPTPSETKFILPCWSGRADHRGMRSAYPLPP